MPDSPFGKSPERESWKDLEMNRRTASSTAALAAMALVSASISARPYGERPAVAEHLDQAEIDSGSIPFARIFEQGRLIFDAQFNFLDGRGRPGSTGGGAPRDPMNQPEFLRTSGPDSNSCLGCHNFPRSGGAGDFVANVFVLAQTLDPVTLSVDPNFSNERNTLGMMGAGAIEMLAREMTVELHAIRDEARATAIANNTPQTRTLIAKGVSFGSITVLPSGKIDPTGIEGVDWDLIVKPFHQKGAVVSLREFTNNAMNHHHGIQTVERFGLGVDADGDGVVNELTVGDVTAATIYQAALNAPQQVMPRGDREHIRVIRHGEEVFHNIGCTTCHVSQFVLASRLFTEPNPFNPAGNLRVSDVPVPLAFDMTRDGEKPCIERGPNGTAIIFPFTDLKRHNLNDAQINHFDNEIVPQGKLNGFAPESDFTIPAPPRPTAQFLTRKLWDVGNTGPYGHRGDLSTISEAIWAHGGDARVQRDSFVALPQEEQDALIEFLKSLQIVPPKGRVR